MSKDRRSQKRISLKCKCKSCECEVQCMACKETIMKRDVAGTSKGKPICETCVMLSYSGA